MVICLDGSAQRKVAFFLLIEPLKQDCGILRKRAEERSIYSGKLGRSEILPPLYKD